MTAQTVCITENDMNRLRHLLKTGAEQEKDTAVLSVLENKLRQARIIGSRDIPDDVVTMNSCIRLRHSDTSKESECWLRFPEGATVPSRDVSILTDLGVALLGSKEGESIEWGSESGVEKSRIVEIVYQPERLGNFER